MLSPSLGSRVNSTKHLLFFVEKRGKQILLPQCGIRDGMDETLTVAIA